MRITAELMARGPAAAIVLDDHQVAELGHGAKRFPVAATINGYTWPPALSAALAADAEASARFEALAYTHRREFARWIAEAKRDETRERRVVKALEMLRAGDTVS
jgi:uncharacterized protein YdeI (YjbR/CyaY-like superfamily)